ncbi:MAG: T9SS type A sorting domain-containing protein [Bacteroidales bacterium]|jgi:hypothetical protein
MSRILITICLIIITTTKISAQEYIFDIGNPILKEYSKKYFKAHGNVTTKNSLTQSLDLPFYDDFSNSFIYPDSSKWIDKYAFINNTYAKKTINIGVATLDAINQFGEVYPYLPSYSSAIADKLTSRPIKLNVVPEDSVYLSFYYQAGGYGNNPELKDSLVLQFKAPDIEWTSVWHAAGGYSTDTFKLVMIPISDTRWLVDGFQFRFLNYASVSTNYEPSWISNCDHWHIDNVYLDTARNWFDTLPNDAAFVTNFTSMIKDFESIPWHHYKSLSNKQAIIKDTLYFEYNNSFPTDVLNINRKFEIVDLYSGNTLAAEYDDNENIQPLSTIKYAKPVNFVYNSTSEDSANFIIKGFLGTDVIQQRNIFRWNDTIRYHQKFYNYYAYDDGTAEKGYGISGVNTAYSSLAYRFTPLMPDTLRGVFIYFNHVMNNGNQKYFYLTVWSHKNGFPGDTLIRMEGVRPEFNDEINGFVYYTLSRPIYIDTTFYIGWTKTTDDMLNCGFDVNNIANQNLFVNITGEWQQSQIPGAIMIRPVFGYEPAMTVVSPTTSSFAIYPNPARDVIFIDTEKEFEYIEIFDINSRIVLKQKFAQNLDISTLENGIYFVMLTSKNKSGSVQKLFITR